MNPKELKINNLVIDEATTHIVVGVDNYYVKSYWHKDKERETLYETPIDQINPIPLNDEWLLKLGFVKGEYHTYDKDLLLVCLKGQNYRNGRTYFNSWCILEKQPEFVHQLQNLWYALTGTDLTIPVSEKPLSEGA